MNIKNYTTTVSAASSIEAIERLLVSIGSTNIMKEYEQGRVAAISFILPMDNMKLPFKLPARVKACYGWLKKKKPSSKDQSLMEQAERIVWRQLHEWVHLQISLLELQQAEKLELFFPYLHDVQNNLTYYEKIKEGKFKALLT